MSKLLDTTPGSVMKKMLDYINYRIINDRKNKKEKDKMKTYKIVIHDPNKVDLDNDKFTKQSTIFEDYKEFNSRHELKEWLLDYVEIIEMI